ncbi:four helix bundle protein [Desulfosarcina sp. BuS5]|uniref:four helix bundle protein n=1 Tax=Desulfosarcina sp. BuS5 TaxID=933262 RepID=UPI00350ECF97
MRRNQILLEKTYQFALDVIGLYKAMLEQNEYIISKQIVRSGTSIGANVEEL